VSAVPLGDRTVLAAVWRVRAGRVTLYLLDTDLPENAPKDRELSARLYGGDRETRLQQEIVLGIGGVRALRALGIDPALYHLNEGHAGFVVLQRVRDLCEQGQTFDAALAEVRRTTVFTTHTPVPAGHDAFSFGMVEAHLAGLWGDLGDNRARFLDLGSHDNGAGPMFNMTALAMRSAASVNGVSQLHGEVTRQMWQPLWPGTPASKVPVKSITNGVHVPTWMSAEIARLLDRYLGPEWAEDHDDPELCERVLEIPDEELWGARVALRTFLFQFVRERARQRWTTEGGAAARVVAAGTMFDQNALTIGYARRFTGYKRPELLFTDPQRLAAIVNKWGRPVQFVFAGKAHPADDGGKHHLQHIYHRALDPMFGGRIAVVDDYDLHVSHFLVQGCDVWLNNPRKPLEASGTSGMKAAINGTPHLSIGDGWWAEGFTGENGWLIEGTANPDDHGAQDWADAQALYTLLEQQVVPAFYDRDGSGVPHRWLQTVKQSIRTVLPRFSARRMVKEYVREMYVPALTEPRKV
jgi:starch phosphorylase